MKFIVPGVSLALTFAILAIFAVAASRADSPGIVVTEARIGCLAVQKDGNLTQIVAKACNGSTSCSFKAPTEAEYKKQGVKAATKSFCSQGMDITYHCAGEAPVTVAVAGDAWNHPAAELKCASVSKVAAGRVETNVSNAAANSAGIGVPNGATDRAGVHVVEAKIGCLREQHSGNLTPLVAAACDGKKSCSYKAPTESEYKKEGVRAETRPLCTQGMQITYRCGSDDPNVVNVDGDAWKHPPAQLECGTVADDEDVADHLPDEPCTQDWPSKYVVTPPGMLDWSRHDADTFPIENHAPPPATQDMYNTTTSRVGSPGSTIGANEGRLVPGLRAVAARKDPSAALCDAARAFASDAQMGNALADLAVTGRATFEKFQGVPPTVNLLKGSCPGVPETALNRALARAYAVANAVRATGVGVQPSVERSPLGWIAVSGEDDKPLRPVNVPTAPFPQFNLSVDVDGLAGAVKQVTTRYMIAHARPPTFQSGPVRGEAPYQLRGELLPAIAPDAEVILFIHGMDSKSEEALNLTGALHRLANQPGGKNWTVISFDLPTSGYADSIDPSAFGMEVGCHHTAMLDFLENFIVKFVDELDSRTGGALKPRIRSVVGGSLGGNMAMRLGRRNFLPGAQPLSWIHTVTPWSPAAIWPSYIIRGSWAGCDTAFSPDVIGLAWSLDMSAIRERVQDRRNFFYGGFDYAPPGKKPQAQYWWRDGWGGGGGLGACKASAIVGARIDRQETYDAQFRMWHWRLAAEQLAFSHRQNWGAPGRPEFTDPLYLYNRTPTLLLSGQLDTGGDLGKWAHDTAPRMTRTPGEFRWLADTGHSLDDERPMYVAQQIVTFLEKHP